MSPDEMLAVMRRVVEGFPPPLRDLAREVRLCVSDVAAKEVLSDLGISDPLDLTGLYEGVPLTEKSIWDGALPPDTVWLFRQAILQEWQDRGDIDLERLVVHVTVHEFAHHFGWSDDDIARVDTWWL
ncbi:metallopeptidase family protein [Pseudooceanicola sp. C21-150M6]|uniref:metallopeptidase family protein n=1 Tax=Pseudooceanicola sp. C21-150M6 TaxID=3434355 RepID=UPI003D7FF295